MAVTYTLKETFTGKRTITTPDPENEGKTIETTTDVTDILVEFKSDSPDVTHTRHVNVCFDGSGNYDDTATKMEAHETVMVVYEDILDDSEDADLPVTATRVKHLTKLVEEGGAATDYSKEDALVKVVCAAIWA